MMSMSGAILLALLMAAWQCGGRLAAVLAGLRELRAWLRAATAALADEE